jgi:UDP-glucose 4-epimerase
MRVLVTGGGGFIGSHLVAKLLLNKNEVVVIDDFSSGKISNLSHLLEEKNLKIIEGSICSQSLVDSLMAEVSHCFHLAATLGVEKINNDPLNSIQKNLEGSKNVIYSACKARVRTLIASSSEVYGKNTAMPLAEDSDRVLGTPKISRWSYSEAKAIDELYAFELYRKKQFRVTIARLFNTVGINQSSTYGMVIPRFLRSALQNIPIVIYGSGKQSRTFCSVSDVVRAFDLLIKSNNTVGQVFNIGSKNEISIINLAHRIKFLTNSKSAIVYEDHSMIFGENFEEPFRRVPDISKISQTIGWQPEKSLDEIILEIAQHIKSNDY